MLILRRKAGESLVIGDEIKVTVIDINEGSIRLAIDAPKRITILRTELLQAADANRDAAAQSRPQEPQKLLNMLHPGEASPVRPGRPGRQWGKPAARPAVVPAKEPEGPAAKEQTEGPAAAEQTPPKSPAPDQAAAEPSKGPAQEPAEQTSPKGTATEQTDVEVPATPVTGEKAT